MKFLLDAHLPPSLKKVFADNGFNAIHTLELPAKNETSDAEIIEALNTHNLIELHKDSIVF